MNPLQPRLNDGVYIFITSPIDKLLDIPSIMIFKESEGYTHIINVNDADIHSLQYEGLWSWITLELVTKLDAVGITAAFSKLLAEHDIACNVVAGYYHDHLFVDAARSQEAIQLISNMAPL